MKSPSDIQAAVNRRLGETWAATITATTDAGAWPHKFALGNPTRGDLTSNFAAAQRWALNWAEHATAAGLTLTWKTRKVSGTRQQLPTHVTVESIDQAAAYVGDGWPQKLEKARHQAATLITQFPHANLERTVRHTVALPDLDFDIACTTATWFGEHPETTGLTARQVPVPGLHSKWLNNHQGLIAHLAGLESLNLVNRPRTIDFTYLDPGYLATGKRRHDSVVAGDRTALPYTPQQIIITENKDSAIFFPPIPSGIAVQGGGDRVSAALADAAWIRACPNLIYWGDMDTDGYEIVNKLRATGAAITTILMDNQAFREYQEYGTATDQRGAPLTCQPRKDLPHLTAAERDVYVTITDPAWIGYRRIEQESIPLHVAASIVTELR